MEIYSNKQESIDNLFETYEEMQNKYQRDRR